jgi:hypothetical protein
MLNIKQTNYINKNLREVPICAYSISESDVKDISSLVMIDILSNRFINGSDMNAMICMFDKLFSSTSDSKSNGLRKLSRRVTEWLKKMRLLDQAGVSGLVFMSEIISDIGVIIKTPKHKNHFDDMLREYFIGLREINKIRYKLPNFVYTFGVFICNKELNKPICSDDDYEGGYNETPFVIYEKIPGKNLEYMLSEDKLDFSQFLGLFIQILLALEVAQRDIKFCHFDLHCGNLMCRPVKEGFEYMVPLDNIVYDVTPNDYLAVIIDYGLSTVKHENKIIGSYEHSKHGMMNYMLPGVDMYKFLIFSCYYAYGDYGKTQTQIKNLFSFYGNDDPYDILHIGDKGLEETVIEFSRKCSYSKAGTYTPHNFLKWILDKPEYDDISSKYIRRRKRDTVAMLSFSSSVKTYDEIFRRPDIGSTKAIKIIQDCIKSNSSYIMTLYSVYILNFYNDKLESDDLNEQILKLSNFTKYSKRKMIQDDRNMLLEYNKLIFPDMKKINEDSVYIMNIRIDSNIKKELSKIKIYIDNISFFTDILPYLQFMYTIKEVKSEYLYSHFIESFSLSNHYKIYDKYHMYINRTHRWCNTLIDSLE